MQKTKFSITKVKIDGTNLKANSIIKQLRQYRLSLGIQQVEIARNNPGIFTNGSHISALEAVRQRESSTQINAYAKAIGIKEMTIIF